jgi:hypothetical protein
MLVYDGEPVKVVSPDYLVARYLKPRHEPLDDGSAPRCSSNCPALKRPPFG